MAKCRAMALLLLFTLPAASAIGSGLPEVVSNPFCVPLHCGTEAAACMADTTCRTKLMCEAGCNSLFKDDTDPLRLKGQNCSNKCVFSYDSDQFDTFMSCMVTNKCMELPTIPNECKTESDIHVLKKVDMDDLLGDWWVVRGHHPIYDCYPCQLMHFNKFNDTHREFNPQYQVYLVNDTLRLMDQHSYYNDYDPKMNRVRLPFKDGGLEHHEDWYIVDKFPEHGVIVVHFCSYTLNWHTAGSVVLSKNSILPAEVEKLLPDVVRKSMGYDISEYCTNKVKDCPEPRSPSPILTI